MIDCAETKWQPDQTDGRHWWPLYRWCSQVDATVEHLNDKSAKRWMRGQTHKGQDALQAGSSREKSAVT